MKKWQLFTSVILLLLLLCSCSATSDGDTVETPTDIFVEATWTPLPTLQSRPSFIKEVSPPESVSTPLEVYQYEHPEFTVFGSPKPDDAWVYGYKSQICADIDLGELVLPGDNLGADAETAERFQLMVNDLETPAEYVGGMGGAVLVIENSMDPPASWEHYSEFCWYVPLGVGIHKVVLRFHEMSGDFQEYAWQFALTDMMPPRIPTPTTIPAGTPVPLPIAEPFPTPASRPTFIHSVIPEPAAVVPIDLFDNMFCVDVVSDGLHDSEYFGESMQVFLNGTSIQAAQLPVESDGMVVTKVSIENVVAAGNDQSVWGICWHDVVLLPGMYDARVVLAPSESDSLEYRWQFVIEE